MQKARLTQTDPTVTFGRNDRPGSFGISGRLGPENAGGRIFLVEALETGKDLG